VLSDPNGDWLTDLRDAMKSAGESPYARALLNLARELSNEGITNLRAFLREIEDRAEQNNPPTLPGVTLATLHAAKGLEWEKVYLVGASDGILPWRGESLEEERRLFYVGITRARKTLALSYWGAPSPFLSEAGLAK
jgi:DNA helicase-2/ATP-dependent DNA helicase PcrA